MTPEWKAACKASPLEENDCFPMALMLTCGFTRRSALATLRRAGAEYDNELGAALVDDWMILGDQR